MWIGPHNGLYGQPWTNTGVFGTSFLALFLPSHNQLKDKHQSIQVQIKLQSSVRVWFGSELEIFPCFQSYRSKPLPPEEIWSIEQNHKLSNTVRNTWSECGRGPCPFKNPIQRPCLLWKSEMTKFMVQEHQVTLQLKYGPVDVKAQFRTLITLVLGMSERVCWKGNKKDPVATCFYPDGKWGFLCVHF